jgi:hypothetical protein
MYGTVKWPDGSPVADRVLYFWDPSAIYRATPTTNASGQYAFTGNTGVEITLSVTPTGVNNLTCPDLTSTVGSISLTQGICSVIFVPHPSDPQSNNPYYAAPPNGTEVDWTAAPYMVDSGVGNDFESEEMVAQTGGGSTSADAELYYANRGA